MRIPQALSNLALALLLGAFVAGGCRVGDTGDGGIRYLAEGSFESQGHRGARGLLPENSIAAAKLALDLGAQAIELDVVVSADQVIIVSHDHYFKSDVCDPKAAGYGEEVPLYCLTATQIQNVTCGAKRLPEFAYQRPLPAPKPTLAEFIGACDSHAVHTDRLLPHYTIEIKSGPGSDGTLTPTPEAFASLVLAQILSSEILARSTVQSFDPRPIRYLSLQTERPRLAGLTLLPASPQALRSRFGDGLAVYSPNHLGLTKAGIARHHRAGLKVVPWTVNDVTRMRTLRRWGVDGIITDYPDRLARVLSQSD